MLFIRASFEPLCLLVANTSHDLVRLCAQMDLLNNEQKVKECDATKIQCFFNRRAHKKFSFIHSYISLIINTHLL